jgi:5-methylcytosine-specific restriction endonuclease McrA
MSVYYLSLLKNPRWFKKRKEILDRDGHKCRNCGATKNLHVHHKQYHYHKSTKTQTLPWDYDDKYLITLCEVCHDLGHKKYTINSFKI